MKENSNFCSLPFTNFYTYNTGTVRMCCDSDIVGRINKDHLDFESIWNGDKWKEIRKSFLENKRHPACQKCWKKEDNGLLSPRIGAKKEKFLKNTYKDGTSQVGPEEIHMRLGNECNLKCIICTPHNSTLWYPEADIYSKYVDDNFGDEIKPDLLHNQWSKDAFKNAKVILFAGGEPFIIPQHQKIIDYLIETEKSKDISLIYYTNAIKIPDRILSKFKEFYHVTLNVSIDGHHETYDYIRYPGKWEQIVQNLKKIDNLNFPNLKWRIVSVFFNLTAFDIDKLYEFRNREKWNQKPEIILQDLTEPIFYDVRNLSKKNKDIVTNKLRGIIEQGCISDKEKDSILRTIDNVSEKPSLKESKSFKILKKYLKELDKRRGLDYKPIFKNIIPHL